MECKSCSRDQMQWDSADVVLQKLFTFRLNVNGRSSLWPFCWVHGTVPLTYVFWGLRVVLADSCTFLLASWCRRVVVVWNQLDGKSYDAILGDLELVRVSENLSRRKSRDISMSCCHRCHSQDQPAAPRWSDCELWNCHWQGLHQRR